MKKFEIYAGLSGGFGGARYRGIEEFETEEEAFNYAWETAVMEYQSHEGFHGILSEGEIEEKLREEWGEDPSEDSVREIYLDKMKSWITYYAKEVKK